MLDKTLHKDLNECLLFHGTAYSSIDAIARLGFDVRLSRDAYYGRGIYLAETFDKAFLYTGKVFTVGALYVIEHIMCQGSTDVHIIIVVIDSTLSVWQKFYPHLLHTCCQQTMTL